MSSRPVSAALKLLSPLRLAAVLLSLAAAPALAQKTIHVPADYPTIQAAVNAANTGDTVLVASGTYTENVAITGKEINLLSSGGTANTVIDGNATGAAIKISNTLSQKTLISGFTLTNGRSGGDANAAGVELSAAGATIDNNVFTANLFAVDAQYSSVSFTDNQVNTTIPGATCVSGSGVRLFGDSSTVLAADGTVADTTIAFNTINATSTAKCLSGIGILAQQSNTLSIAYNQISGESLAIDLFSTPGEVYVTNNLITGNLMGGLYIAHYVDSPPADPADTFVVNNTFANNLSGATGYSSTSGTAGPAEVAISGTYSKVALIDNILATNSATNPLLDCSGAAPSATVNVTPVILDHNLFYNANAAGQIGTHGCPVAIGTLGNINAAPGFVSSTNFHLAAGSPAIDAGNNVTLTPDLDLDQNPRVQSANSSTAPVVDIGAYEYPGTSGGTYSTLSLTASTYYTSSNTVTLSGLLLHGPAGDVLSASPNQTVTVYENGANPQTVTTNANGYFFVPAYTLPTQGLYTFTATSAAGTYPASAATVVYVLSVTTLPVTTLTLTSNLNPSPVGSNVTFTITSNSTDNTHPAPIVLADNGVTLTTFTANATGIYTYSTATLTAGSHPLTATFAGDSGHASATASLTQVVGQAGDNITLTSSQNPAPALTPVTFTINSTAADGTHPGPIVLTDNGVALTGPLTPDGNGNAALITGSLTVGTHPIKAAFAGDTNHAAGSASLNQVITLATTSLTLSAAPNPSPALSPIVFTVQLLSGGQATGAGNTVTLTIGPANGTSGAGLTVSLTTDATGTARASIGTLTPGAYPVTATFAGSSSYGGSSATTITVLVNPNPTTTTLLAAPSPGFQNQTETIVATVAASTGASAPSGTLTILDGATPLTSQTLAGGSGSMLSSITFTTTTLTVGVHNLMAVYTPANSSFLASQSSVFALTINPQDFALTTTPPTITVQTQHHTSLTLSIASIGGFAAPMTLTCGPALPPYLTCGVSAVPVTLAANATATTTVTLETDVIPGFMASASPDGHQPGGRLAPIGLALTLSVPLALLGLRRRRRLLPLLAFAALAVLSTALTACGGKYPASVAPGTYIIPITASGTTAGSPNPTTHTLNLTLTVTP